MIQFVDTGSQLINEPCFWSSWEDNVAEVAVGHDNLRETKNLELKSEYPDQDQEMTGCLFL